MGNKCLWSSCHCNIPWVQSKKSDIIDCDKKVIKVQITKLWDKLPVFRNTMIKVPTLRIPKNKSLIEKALKDPDFSVATKVKSDLFFYSC